MALSRQADFIVRGNHRLLLQMERLLNRPKVQRSGVFGVSPLAV